MVTYLGTRNVAMFSCDLDSFDFKASKPQQVIDVTLRNVDRFESVCLEFAADAFDESALETCLGFFYWGLK